MIEHNEIVISQLKNKNMKIKKPPLKIALNSVIFDSYAGFLSLKKIIT